MSYRGEIEANTQITVKIGPYLDSTDGNTNETGLSIAQADIRLSKNGGNFAQVNHNQGGGNLTHDELGYYGMTLDTADTNTEGRLLVVVHESGALLVELSFNVLAQAAYDSKYTAKDAGFMDVNIKTVGRADAQETEANNLESACSNYSVTRGLTGTAVPAVTAESAGGLFTRGSGAGQINQDTNGQVDVDVQKWLGTTVATPTTGGVPEVDLTYLMGTILTEGAGGRLAAALIKFLDVVTPNGTINSLPGADADAAGGLVISDAGGLDIDAKLANTNEVTAARMGALTDWIDGGRLDLILDIIAADVVNIDGSAIPTPAAIVNEWETQSQADPTGFHVNVREWLSQAVALSGNNRPDVNIDEISDDLTAPGLLELLVENAKGADHKILISTDAQDLSTSFDVNIKAITAGIIANASFNSDVGSTAYASNIIALAVRKLMDELNLDHLMKVVTAGADMTTEIADNSALSRILANGDTSAFDPSTDGLQLIRDAIGLIATKAQMDTAHDLLATVAKQDVIDGIVDNILVDTALMDKWLKNKIAFSGTSMILYDDDNSTPLLTWTLSEGSTSVSGPYNRAKAT